MANLAERAIMENVTLLVTAKNTPERVILFFSKEQIDDAIKVIDHLQNKYDIKIPDAALGMINRHPMILLNSHLLNTELPEVRYLRELAANGNLAHMDYQGDLFDKEKIEPLIRAELEKLGPFKVSFAMKEAAKSVALFVTSTKTSPPQMLILFQKDKLKEAMAMTEEFEKLFGMKLPDGAVGKMSGRYCIIVPCEYHGVKTPELEMLEQMAKTKKTVQLHYEGQMHDPEAEDIIKATIESMDQKARH